MKIECPCGLVVKKVDDGGVILFRHKRDGSSCIYLNRMDVTVNGILMKHRGRFDDEYIPSMYGSKSLRLEHWKYLSSLRGRQLVDELHSLNAKGIIRYFSYELLMTFGTVFAVNCRKLGLLDVFGMVPIPEIPQLYMSEVETGLDASYAQIDREIDNKRKALQDAARLR